MADNYQPEDPEGTWRAGYPGGQLISNSYYTGGGFKPRTGGTATLAIPTAAGASAVYGRTTKSKEALKTFNFEQPFRTVTPTTIRPRTSVSPSLSAKQNSVATPAVPKFTPSVIKPGVEENLPGGLTTERVAPGALVPQFSPSTANPAKTPLGVLDPNTKPGRKLGLQPNTNPQTKPNPQPQPQNKSPKRSSNQVKTKEKTRRLLSPGSAVAAPGQFGSDVRWKTTFSRY